MQNKTIETSNGNWNPAQQTYQQASQLVKIVRAGHVHILTKRNFITLLDFFNAERYDGNLLSDARALADATRSGNYFAREPARLTRIRSGHFRCALSIPSRSSLATATL